MNISVKKISRNDGEFEQEDCDSYQFEDDPGINQETNTFTLGDGDAPAAPMDDAFDAGIGSDWNPEQSNPSDGIARERFSKLFQGKTHEEIQQIADASGIDLDHLPTPPNAELFEFLAKNMPGLKQAYQDAKDAIAYKTKLDQDMSLAAARKSTANLASTTDVDSDREGLKEFVYLCKAQKFQDEGSQRVMVAFSQCAVELAAALRKLYPGTPISNSAMTISDCDLICFDGQKIDVLKNSDGSFIAATNLVEDPEMKPPAMVTLAYDWEGDGDWEDGDHSKLQWLKTQGYPTAGYDSNFCDSIGL